MNGIINLYKAKGVTSHDCVNAVRRILGTRTVGHFGTLDPQGEGVLLIGVGKCTRLFDFFLSKDKVYEAEFTFGYETDTLDGEGAVTVSGGAVPDGEAVVKALSRIRGDFDQIPPQYSAKSVGGVRAYALARKGIDVALPPKKVTVYSAEALNYEPPALRVRIHCSAGTYIRSICRDTAHSLGTVAVMTAIKRVRCGAFAVEDAVTVGKLERLGEAALVPPETALADRPRFDADESFFKKLVNGVRTDVGAPEGTSVLYCRGELFGLASTEGGITRIKTLLR